MDKVTQSQTATAEESASASEELNAQAMQMEGFVSDLKVLVYGRANSSDNTHENAPVAQEVAVDEKRKALPSSNPF
jgi:methyl-accepting chemotaxis protein